MTNTDRRDELAGFLEEASARVSDGTRVIGESDARGIAVEILHGDRSPEWISHQPLGSDYFVGVLAHHQTAEWHPDVVQSGPWGTAGWVCKCGVVITEGIDLGAAPPRTDDVGFTAIWMARHQLSILTARSGL